MAYSIILAHEVLYEVQTIRLNIEIAQSGKRFATDAVERELIRLLKDLEKIRRMSENISSYSTRLW